MLYICACYTYVYAVQYTYNIHIRTDLTSKYLVVEKKDSTNTVPFYLKYPILVIQGFVDCYGKQVYPRSYKIAAKILKRWYGAHGNAERVLKI